MTFQVRVRGLDAIIAGIARLQGKELTDATRKVLTAVSKQKAVPIMRSEVPDNASGGKRSKRSPWERPTPRNPNVGQKGGPMRKKITVRSVKRRTGELVALTIGPRTWYDHFVARSTKPHIIIAWDSAGNRASANEIQHINRGPGGYATPQHKALALQYDGVFVNRVYHPGTRGNDYVGRSIRRLEAAKDMENGLASELQRVYTSGVGRVTVP